MKVIILIKANISLNITPKSVTYHLQNVKMLPVKMLAWCTFLKHNKRTWLSKIHCSLNLIKSFCIWYRLHAEKRCTWASIRKKIVFLCQNSCGTIWVKDCFKQTIVTQSEFKKKTKTLTKQKWYNNAKDEFQATAITFPIVPLRGMWKI